MPLGRLKDWILSFSNKARILDKIKTLFWGSFNDTLSVIRFYNKFSIKTGIYF